jgi:hypothetical protein
MIDISLIDEPIAIEEFEKNKIDVPCLFLGFIIKNEYDNQRLHINEKFNPRKSLYVYNGEGKDLSILPLYGVTFEANETALSIVKLLDKQEKNNNVNIIVYENILQQFNLSCNECYGHFTKKIYPIDFKHLRKLTDDPAAKDKKILQHMLDFSENKFDFQKFGSLKILILK